MRGIGHSGESPLLVHHDVRNVDSATVGVELSLVGVDGHGEIGNGHLEQAHPFGVRQRVRGACAVVELLQQRMLRQIAIRLHWQFLGLRQLQLLLQTQTQLMHKYFPESIHLLLEVNYSDDK